MNTQSDNTHTAKTKRAHTDLGFLASLTAMFCAFSVNSSAQTPVDATNFPDDTFRAWVVANVAGAEDNLLTQEEIDAVGELTLTDGNDFSGIGLFTKLSNLTVRQWGKAAAASTIDLHGMTNLRKVDIASDRLTRLDVSGCSAIDTIFVNKEAVGKEIAITGLEDATTLSTARIRGGNFGTHLDFNALTTAKTLDLRQSVGLDTLDLPIRADTIRVDSSQVAHLNVSASPTYQYLSCSHNNLTALNLRGGCVNKIADISHQEKTVSVTVEEGWVMFDIDREFSISYTVPSKTVVAGGHATQTSRTSYEDGYRFGVQIAAFIIDSKPEALIGKTITYNYAINCGCHADIIGTIDNAPAPETDPGEPHWICD